MKRKEEWGSTNLLLCCPLLLHLIKAPCLAWTWGVAECLTALSESVKTDVSTSVDLENPSSYNLMFCFFSYWPCSSCEVKASSHSLILSHCNTLHTMGQNKKIRIIFQCKRLRPFPGLLFIYFCTFAYKYCQHCVFYLVHGHSSTKMQGTKLDNYEIKFIANGENDCRWGFYFVDLFALFPLRDPATIKVHD